MERTITYEGTKWRVWVNPALAGRDTQSGLELVFTDEAGEHRVVSPVGRPLLRTLSREGLELDEAILVEELRRALDRSMTPAPDTDGRKGAGDGEYQDGSG